jgi:ABC-type ATPase with predicted acetyltransferase domain
MLITKIRMIISFKIVRLQFQLQTSRRRNLLTIAGYIEKTLLLIDIFCINLDIVSVSKVMAPLHHGSYSSQTPTQAITSQTNLCSC